MKTTTNLLQGLAIAAATMVVVLIPLLSLAS